MDVERWRQLSQQQQYNAHNFFQVLTHTTLSSEVQNSMSIVMLSLILLKWEYLMRPYLSQDKSWESRP